MICLVENFPKRNKQISSIKPRDIIFCDNMELFVMTHWSFPPENGTTKTSTKVPSQAPHLTHGRTNQGTCRKCFKTDFVLLAFHRKCMLVHVCQDKSVPNSLRLTVCFQKYRA